MKYDLFYIRVKYSYENGTDWARMCHIHYGILLWGTKLDCINKIQKKAVRIISNSNYIAHSEPLLKELSLLNVEDIFNLKLLKFYYNLSYNLLPTYPTLNL